MCIRCLIRGNASRWLAKGISLRAEGHLPAGLRCMEATCRRCGPGRARWSGRQRCRQRRRRKGLRLQRLLAVCRSGRSAGDCGRRCVGRRNAGQGDCDGSGRVRPPALRSGPGRASRRRGRHRPGGRAGPGRGWTGASGRRRRRG
nr:MAG TPA: hypothetical protein [Caudoviricetes sp.]DAQ50082.1 MAG TPA: hypothetical protein [Caudoviricetes sp.]